MSLILVFDVETTGLLPKAGSAEPKPHIIQFSFILYDVEECTVVESHNYYISVGPEVVISPKITELTGITRQICDSQGIPIMEALIQFERLYNKANIVVAHNQRFDSEMIRIEIERNHREPRIGNMVLFDKEHDAKCGTVQICTMMTSVHVCNIMVEQPGRKPYPKWPTLLELHRHLFATTPANLHNAIVDVLVCMRCFVNLYFNIVIDEPEFSAMIVALA
jgi:DNA polymerase III epsilon subunit-like protein